ncbi:MAG: UDP-glucose/GDP-mannose dehydrogenase family protein [Pseudomonadales bacterium]|nr:UDP-glucose/GDP-mannose dehydrogenase family protein [Pseudomonadales bacterium]
MKLVIVGTGYVGLVTGTCFAEMGNQVICVDVDVAKVSALKSGQVPIYEPGLEPMVQDNLQAGRLSFTMDLQEALIGADMAFIAVGTPPREDGSADLQYVLAVARNLGRMMTGSLVIVDKSTVPVGTADQVRAAIEAELSARQFVGAWDVVSNPEFLKEGAAVDDFMRPDRIVIGTDSPRARALMEDLYAPFMRNHNKLLFMRTRDAEMTKYAANAMLATKISFINEMALLAESLDVDIEQVRLGIGADQRIGHHFIYPGCGYGGSCFPKDVQALIRMAHEQSVEPWLLDAVEKRNHAQKSRLFDKVQQILGGDLSGRTIGIWGLAFKPGTDDIREAPASLLIESLLQAGAQVRAHDPVAMPNSQEEFAEAAASGKISYCQDPYEAVRGVDALVLVTEWKPYRQPDFERLKSLLRTPVIIDGRNQYAPDKLRQAGFIYSGIGR